LESLRAKEAKAFGQDLQDAFGEKDAVAFGIFLEDVEDNLVFLHRADVLDAHVAGHRVEVGHAHGLKFGDVDETSRNRFRQVPSNIAELQAMSMADLNTMAATWASRTSAR